MTYAALENLHIAFDEELDDYDRFIAVLNALYWIKGIETLRTGDPSIGLGWFDPFNGRLLSNDPIGLNGGLNQYVFCGNNPVNKVDPDGLISVGALLAIIAYDVGVPALIGGYFGGWKAAGAAAVGGAVGIIPGPVGGAMGGAAAFTLETWWTDRLEPKNKYWQAGLSVSVGLGALGGSVQIVHGLVDLDPFTTGMATALAKKWTELADKLEKAGKKQVEEHVDRINRESACGE